MLGLPMWHRELAHNKPRQIITIGLCYKLDFLAHPSAHPHVTARQGSGAAMILIPWQRHLYLQLLDPEQHRLTKPHSPQDHHVLQDYSALPTAGRSFSSSRLRMSKDQTEQYASRKLCNCCC